MTCRTLINDSRLFDEDHDGRLFEHGSASLPTFEFQRGIEFGRNNVEALGRQQSLE